MEIFGIKINKILEQFARDRNWDKFHSTKNLALALSVECSKLLECFQCLNEAESNNFSQDPGNREKLEDEVADIFIYLQRIVIKNSIDLEAAVINKMKKNTISFYSYDSRL